MKIKKYSKNILGYKNKTLTFVVLLVNFAN